MTGLRMVLSLGLAGSWCVSAAPVEFNRDTRPILAKNCFACHGQDAKKRKGKLRLDQEGIRCSQGSACTNQKPEPSYVLRAMGLSEAEAYASVRFSFSELNTIEEIDSALESIMEIHASLARFAVA